MFWNARYFAARYFASRRGAVEVAQPVARHGASFRQQLSIGAEVFAVERPDTVDALGIVGEPAFNLAELDDQLLMLCA